MCRMDKAKVIEVLKGVLITDTQLHSGVPWVSHHGFRDEVTLDGDFTAEELEAILYWMRHKEEFKADQQSDTGPVSPQQTRNSALDEAIEVLSCMLEKDFDVYSEVPAESACKKAIEKIQALKDADPTA